MSESFVDIRALRSFGLVMAGAIAVLFGLGLPWLSDRPYPAWPWLAAGGLAALALLFPAGLGPFYRGWMVLGHALGWVNTRLLLALVFFVVITPAGLLMRLFGRDPMRRRFEPGLASYRVPHLRPSEPSDMERPF